MPTGQADAPKPKKLTGLQQRFVEAYARIWKGAPAAVLAGYAEGSAKQTARNLLQLEHIQAAIVEEAARLGMTVDEATVRMSEWGRVTVDDLMTLGEEEYTTYVDKPFREVVEEFYENIVFEQELAIRQEILFTDKKEQKRFRNKQQELHLKRLLEYERLKMELEKEPNKVRQVPGPKAVREVVRLDLVKVYKHKAGHLIKKVKETRYGLEIETHDAKDATDKILKLHGAYAPEKHDVTTNGKDLPGSNIMMPDNGRD